MSESIKIFYYAIKFMSRQVEFPYCLKVPTNSLGDFAKNASTKRLAGSAGSPADPHSRLTCTRG